MSATTLYKFRIYCLTEGTYVYTDWRETTPTQCPNNSSDTIDTQTITIVGALTPNTVQIKEEPIPTGGNYFADQMEVNAIKNTTSYATKVYPFNISALQVRYDIDSSYHGDEVSFSIGKDTPIGAITANLSPAPVWVSQNYVAGDRVSFTHPVFGLRVYTCILNTVSNEDPTDETYWTHGYMIPGTPTVAAVTMVGYYISLFNGTNKDELGRVISIDAANNQIFVENNLVNSFAAVTPTQILQSVYIVKDLKLYGTGVKEYGGSKIGASSIPKNTFLRLEYKNKSTTDDKVFLGEAEILY